MDIHRYFSQLKTGERFSVARASYDAVVPAVKVDRSESPYPHNAMVEVDIDNDPILVGDNEIIWQTEDQALRLSISEIKKIGNLPVNSRSYLEFDDVRVGEVFFVWLENSEKTVMAIKISAVLTLVKMDDTRYDVYVFDAEQDTWRRDE